MNQRLQSQNSNSVIILHQVTCSFSLTSVRPLLASVPFAATLRPGATSGRGGTRRAGAGLTAHGLRGFGIGSLQLGIFHQILLAEALDLLPTTRLFHDQLVLVLLLQMDVRLLRKGGGKGVGGIRTIYNGSKQPDSLA